MTYHDLLKKLHDHPFRPFRIRMVNNTVYDVREPWVLVVGDSSAIIVTETHKADRGAEIALDWKTVSISHMMEFTDLNIRSNGKRKK